MNRLDMTARKPTWWTDGFEASWSKVRSEIIAGHTPRFPGESPAADRCVITIEDNGIGFDDKHAERVFTARGVGRLTMDMVLTGRMMGAEEALQRGLAARVVPPELEDPNRGVESLKRNRVAHVGAGGSLLMRPRDEPFEAFDRRRRRRDETRHFRGVEQRQQRRGIGGAQFA